MKKTIKTGTYGAIGTLTILIGGCGGGGGGGSSTVTLTPFTTISSITAGQTIYASGQSVETTWTGSTTAITSVAAPSAVTTATTVTGTYSSSTGILNKLVIATPISTTTFDSSAGATFGTLVGQSNVGAVVNSGSTAFAVYPMYPYTTYGWNYQTFGVWETGRGTGSGTGGAVSLGVTTAATALPTSGSATYTGYTGGAYINTTGSLDYLTTSSATLAANFATRSIAFSTTGTVIALPSSPGTTTANTNLNLSGTLSYSSGVNGFSGTVATTGGTLSGTATGRFYGPLYNEVGGVFFTTPTSGVERYAGAFGAKR